MRIVVISSWFYPEASGKEYATYLHLQLLADAGFKFIVITNTLHNSYVREVISKSIEVHRFPQIKYQELSDLLYKLYDKYMNMADKFYVVGKFNLLPIIKGKFKKPVITHLHDYFPFCPFGVMFNKSNYTACYHRSMKQCYRCLSYKPFNIRILKLAFSYSYGYFVKKFSNIILFPSKAHRDLVVKLEPEVKYKSFIVYNPPPPVNYTPINGDDIGYFGGFSAVKGAYFLLKAWTRIFHKYSSHLHMARSQNIPMYLAKRLNIIPHGNLQGKSYEKVYRKIKAVIVPSLSPDTAPLVPIEACLHGRPVIATNIGGIPEYIGGLPGVKLIPPNDVDALVEGLEWALSMDKSEAMEIGLKNRQEILRRLDREKIKRTMIRIFENV